MGTASLDSKYSHVYAIYVTNKVKAKRKASEDVLSPSTISRSKKARTESPEKDGELSQSEDVSFAQLLVCGFSV